MTKVIILGESHEDVKPKKKIEFVRALSTRGECNTSSEPNEADEIVLLCRKYDYTDYDLMLATWDNGNKYLYLGHFNDGVV